MTTLISTQNTNVRGQTFTRFQVVELSDKQRFDDDIDTLQSYINRGFVEQTPPNGLPKYWKVENRQVVEMDETEKTAVDQSEADAQTQAAINEQFMTLQRDKGFCQRLYDEFLLANRSNPDLTAEQVIQQTQIGQIAKSLVSDGAVVSLRTLIVNGDLDSLLTAPQKAYFLGKIDNYLAQ